MAYNPNNPNGAATAANSAPVAIATDQVQDAFVTGAAQTASGNNLLLTSSGTAAIDTMAYTAGAPTYRSIYIQVISTGTVTGGVGALEGSNDNTTFVAVPYCTSEVSQSFGTSSNFAASGGSIWLSSKISYRYLRLRITSVVLGGGSVQAIYRLSTQEYIPRYQPPSGTTPGIFVLGMPNATTASAVTTAGTNATYVGTARRVDMVAISNPTANAVYVKLYNKGSAPTVGTDVPIVTIPVPASSTFTQNFGVTGMRFSTGLAWAATGGMDATDTTNAPAGVQVALTHI